MVVSTQSRQNSAPAHMFTTIALAVVMVVAGCADDATQGPSPESDVVQAADAVTDANAADGDGAADAADGDGSGDGASDGDTGASPDARDAGDDVRSDGGDVEDGPSTQPLSVLPGDPERPAVGQLPDFGPVFTLDTSIEADGLILDRMIAGIDPDASLADLNAALERHDLGLSLTRSDREWVELSMSRREERAEIEELATAVMDEVAFAWVEPAIANRPEPTVADSGEKSLVSNEVLTLNPYLQTSRFVSAWNLAAAAGRGEIPTVLVLDGFVDVTGHPAISALEFGPNESATLRGGPQSPDDTDFQYNGNHGFWVAGVLAADPDATAPTGTSPDPTRLMRLRGVQGYASNLANVEHLRTQIPPAGNVVVNMSLGYVKKGFVDGPAAIAWRRMMLEAGDRLVVACTAGNSGLERPAADARRNSDCTAQASFDDLRTVVAASSRDSFNVLWNSETTQDPAMARRAGSTWIVGNSNASGGRSATSTPGETIRMIGEQILGPCVLDDNICDNGNYLSSGTSAASPQVAGLAAYVWALEPSLTAAEVFELVNAHYDGRWVNAFAAVMHIAAYRPAFTGLATLVDVNADGRFDAADLGIVLTALETNHIATPNSAIAEQDFARTDLNGDGYTRRDTGAPFAFVPARSPTFGTHRYRFAPDDVDVVLDETAITDLELLCAAAYSNLFAAEEVEARDALLRLDCGSTEATLVIDGSPPASASTGGPAFDVCVRATREERSLSDLAVNFTLTGPGSLSPASVRTNSSGRACVSFTPPGRSSATPSLISARTTVAGRALEVSHSVLTSGDTSWEGTATFVTSTSSIALPNCSSSGSTTTTTASGTAPLRCGAWDPLTGSATCVMGAVTGTGSGSYTQPSRALSTAEVPLGPGGDAIPCETLDSCPSEALFCDQVLRTENVCCGRSEADCVRLSQRVCQTCQVDGTSQASGSASVTWSPESPAASDVTFRLSPAGAGGSVPVSLGTGSGCVAFFGDVTQVSNFGIVGDCSDETRSLYQSSSTVTQQRFTACIANFGVLERSTTGTLASDVLTTSFTREFSNETSVISVSLQIEVAPAGE
jgi:hypothetical protein